MTGVGLAHGVELRVGGGPRRDEGVQPDQLLATLLWLFVIHAAFLSAAPARRIL